MYGMDQKNPSAQKMYVYDRTSNSFHELEHWKKNIYKTSNERNAKKFKDLLDNCPERFDSREVSTMRSNLQVNTYPFISGFVWLAGAVVWCGSGYVIAVSSDNDLRMKAIPYSIGSLVATLGTLAWFDKRCKMHEAHEPIDTILADKIKELQEIEKQAKTH